MNARLQFAARIFLVALFIYAGLPKILAPQAFALVVFRFHLLPDYLINTVALLLPWLEIFAALGLLLPAWRRACMLWLVIMLGIATAALAISLARGLDIDCGCFTLQPGRSHIGWWSLARNATLIALTLWAGWSKPARAP
ncbi:MAG: DoxX family membrane protein [Kiritimatiellaeota bacterium]|nr:DoxX family membrane protein [Kiritimatiellota bacterium]